MEFLGKNALFQLALDFFGIELEEAFDRFKRVKYENDERELVLRESLVFFLKNGGLMSIYRDYVPCLDEPESFTLFSHQSSNDDDVFVYDCILDCGKLALKYERVMQGQEEQEDLPFEIENEEEEADYCNWWQCTIANVSEWQSEKCKMICLSNAGKCPYGEDVFELRRG